MNKLVFSLITLTVAASAQTMAGPTSLKGVYGPDDRRDIYDAQSEAYLELSRSTLAMMSPSSLKPTEKGDFLVSARKLQEIGVCASERFSQQPTAASCSGFLVSDKVVVTAGHCITSMADCNNHKWVFDYKLDSPDQKEITIPSTSVYSCKRILGRKFSAIKNDYTVIELDRAVTDRQPLKFRKRGSIKKGDEILVIGHPSGLPTKISDNAVVRKKGPRSFKSNLDAYGGNSGSAVFNARTLEVEGILASGDQDYRVAGSCYVSVVCENDECRGENSTKITNVKEIMDL